MSVVEKRLLALKMELIELHRKIVENLSDLCESVSVPCRLSSVYSLTEVIREIDKVVEILINCSFATRAKLYELESQPEVERELAKREGIIESIRLINGFLPENKRLDIADVDKNLSVEDLLRKLESVVRTFIETDKAAKIGEERLLKIIGK